MPSLTNPQRWDIFCRVVDNFGDIGVCLRLARQLATEYGVAVRLWVDDLATLARLCPQISVSAAFQRTESVEIGRWTSDFPIVAPADVVIEAFACELPEAYVTAMAERCVPPVWINLEYLTAEDWIEDCHKMRSPHPRLPLTKHFFFPGFTTRTGGLIRERRAGPEESPANDQNDWLASRLGLHRPNAGLTISLFCYQNPALPELLETWAHGNTPIRLLVTPGFAHRQVSDWLRDPLPIGRPVAMGSLTVQAIPFLSQPEYDKLLQLCDVNFVRGEDSFVRAQWAGKPFVWQIYPQEENAHFKKLNAFLSRYLAETDNSPSVRTLWQAWNDGQSIGPAWKAFAPSREMLAEHAKEWVRQLDQAGNLADNLTRFVQQI